MADQFFIRFGSESEAQHAESLLRSFRLSETAPFANGRPLLFHMTREGDSILCQCRCTGIVSPNATIFGESLADPVKFSDVFYQVDTVKSGRHHPDGMLWIRWLDRRHSVQPEKVSLRAIAPTILRMLDVPTPAFLTDQALLPDRAEPVLTAS
jgi:hypothetical protein